VTALRNAAIYGSNVSASARIRTMSNCLIASRRKGRERRLRGGLRPALTPLRSTPVKPALLFMFLYGPASTVFIPTMITLPISSAS
jgi:hypothetical protein